MEDYRTLLDCAETAARAAGSRLREGKAELRTVNFVDRTDVKLQADVESEKLIRGMLEAETGYPIIGEEGGGDAGLTERNEPYWVVDPLDGTFNYLRSIPQNCVSIGLMRGMQPVLGVIYDFNQDELFAAIVGGRFTIDGRNHRPDWATDVGQAVISIGLPPTRGYSEDQLGKYLGRVRGFKKIRQKGSAALSMAYVASGRYDAYFEEGIRLWDIAAGLALVESAGGLTRIEQRRHPPLCYNLWAAGRPEFVR